MVYSSNTKMQKTNKIVALVDALYAVLIADCLILSLRQQFRVPSICTAAKRLRSSFSFAFEAATATPINTLLSLTATKRLRSFSP